MTERSQRLDHLLREEISAIIGRQINDPRVGFVTVTKVDVTPDLGHAMVWVSVIGNESERRTSLRALGRAMPFVRHRLGELHLRRIPELHLREDDSAERGTRVMHILDGLEGAPSHRVDEAPADVPGLPGGLPSPGPVRSTPPEPGVPRPRKPRRSDRTVRTDRSGRAGDRGRRGR